MITLEPILVYKEESNAWLPGDETFTRSEIATKLGLGRTTLWRYESQIVVPAHILDYHRYTAANSRLDCYCIFVLTRAILHFEAEGTYEKASQIMKEQRKLYSRQNYNHFLNQLANNQQHRRIA